MITKSIRTFCRNLSIVQIPSFRFEMTRALFSWDSELLHVPPPSQQENNSTVLDHVVLFKFKEDANEEAIELMREGLRNLENEISQVKGLTEGFAISSDRTKGFDYGFVVKFEDEDGLEEYIVHDVHQKFVKELANPIVEDILALDFISS